VTADRHLAFPFLTAFLPTTKPEKSVGDNITAAGVFSEAIQAGRKGLFSHTEPMCELVEGIVTVPLLVPFTGTRGQFNDYLGLGFPGRKPVTNIRIQRG
jgi:hypothetical protein